MPNQLIVKVNSIEEGNRENYSNTHKEGNYSENRDVNNFRNETIGGKLTDISNINRKDNVDSANNLYTRTNTHDTTNQIKTGLDKNAMATALQDRPSQAGDEQKLWDSADKSFDANYDKAKQAAMSENYTNPHYKQFMAAAVSNVSDVGSASWSNTDSFSASTSQGVNAKMGASFDSSNQVVGWAAEKLTGAKVSGDASVSVGADSSQSTKYDDIRNFEAHRSQFNDMLVNSSSSDNLKASMNNYINKVTDASNDKSDNVDVEDYRNDKK